MSDSPDINTWTAIISAGAAVALAYFAYHDFVAKRGGSTSTTNTVTNTGPATNIGGSPTNVNISPSPIDISTGGITVQTVNPVSVNSNANQFPLFGYAAEAPLINQVSGFEQMSAAEQLQYLAGQNYQSLQSQQMQLAQATSSQQILAQTPTVQKGK